MSPALRVPTDADVSAVVRLLSEHWPEPTTAEHVQQLWTSPDVELADDVRMDDVSYAQVEGLDGERVWIELRGRPSAALLDWAEERAREKGRRLLAGAWATHETLLRDLDARGFQLVRHAHRMLIDLEQETPAAAWPAGVAIRTYAEGDERTFYDLHQETFVDSWEHVETPYELWAHWLLEPERLVPELWFLAEAAGEPAGFAICHPHPGNATLGWVGILGVRRPWRRQGLGRALLLHAFSEFRARGFRRAGLGVDAESLTGAHRLYESAGMHVAARFDIYEKLVV